MAAVSRAGKNRIFFVRFWKRRYYLFAHDRVAFALCLNFEVVLGNRLGHGEFGEVFKGSLTVGLFTRPIDVAVKTLKEDALSSDDRLVLGLQRKQMINLCYK